MDYAQKHAEVVGVCGPIMEKVACDNHGSTGAGAGGAASMARAENEELRRQNEELRHKLAIETATRKFRDSLTGTYPGEWVATLPMCACACVCVCVRVCVRVCVCVFWEHINANAKSRSVSQPVSRGFQATHHPHTLPAPPRPPLGRAGLYYEVTGVEAVDPAPLAGLQVEPVQYK